VSPCLEFRAVRKVYRVRQGVLGRSREVAAVDGVDLAVAPGETVGLVGESGCGKSTLARLATGLIRPTSGSVLLEGRDLETDPDLADAMPETVQMVFQDPVSSLNPRMTVGRSVAEGLEARAVGDKASRRERVAELFDMVGLAPSQAGNYPHQFSGGQRQRVAIARALALNPRLVVLDEPVSALDVSIQAQVINILEDLKNRLGLTYLFISHDLAVVSHLSDRVAVMRAGRLVELAPAGALYAAPLHPYTRLLLAAIPDPHAPRHDVPALEPEPAGAPGGLCPLAPRCPEANPACAQAPPPWLEAAPGHFVRCHAR